MTPFTAPLELQRRQLTRAATHLDRTTAMPEQAERAASVEVGQTESEEIYRENKLTLRHYEPRTEERHDVPILVVYALINRPYVLDLQPNRSVVRNLLDRGFDVYLIDWGEPSRLDASLTLADYVARYLDNCVDEVREHAGTDDVHLLGYCMGGTMSAMYAALHPEKVRTLGLMAASLHFEDSGGVLELWGSDEYFDPEAVTETYGNVPADFLDAGFALMDPVENTFTKYVRLYDNLEDDDFVENFARMETWLGDGIDLAGETYRQFIEDIYQGNKLSRNELHLDGRHVDLERIDMPVLQIVGEYDHLVPPEASVPFNDRVASDDTEVIEFATGHIGLSVSSRSHDDLWPQVSEWYAERSGPQDRLEDVTGIGSTYAERLRDAGIESLRDLVDADVDELSAAADIAPGRLENVIDATIEHLAGVEPPGEADDKSGDVGDDAAGPEAGHEETDDVDSDANE